MGVDAHANSKYLNWFLDSCLSWNWTISCALFAIEKLTLGLFSIILGLKIWSCNCLQLFCGWKFGLSIVFNNFAVENLVLQLFSKIEIYSLALHLLLEILLLRYHQQRKSMDVFKFRKFISGSLVFWFFGSLVHLGFTKLPLKKKTFSGLSEPSNTTLQTFL